MGDKNPIFLLLKMFFLVPKIQIIRRKQDLYWYQQWTEVWAIRGSHAWGKLLLINILRKIIFQLIIYYVVAGGIDAIRAMFGPLPVPVCKIGAFLKVATVVKFCLLSFAMTLTKFVFIFIFKSIPVMDDSFLSFVINSNVTLWTFLTSSAKFYFEPKENIFLRICQGKSTEDKNGHGQPILVATYLLIGNQ